MKHKHDWKYMGTIGWVESHWCTVCGTIRETYRNHALKRKMRYFSPSAAKIRKRVGWWGYSVREPRLVARLTVS